ncbi:MAG TPA: phosphate signaling complex protein PhoU [bacterium]|nr:phosphate signaling complex protein PhoU [bacterium]
MIDRRFDEELNELNNMLLKMATFTQESIYLAIDSIKNRDIKTAKIVIDNDKKIDEFELDIDDFSVELLARRQPLAGDLRFITTGMKINGELERIADLSVNIAERSIDLSSQPLLKPLVDIPIFSELAVNMVKTTIDSFIKRDAELAKKVISMDAEANRLRDTIQKELVEDYIAKDISTLSRGVSLFLVAQHLERICDHAKYIAEAVIYLVSARVVKHNKLKD